MKATARTEDRIDARLSRSHKALLKRAAGLAGQPVSQFLVSCAVERAQQLVEEYTQTRLSAASARRFLALVDADKPNAALVRAAQRYKARGG